MIMKSPRSLLRLVLLTAITVPLAACGADLPNRTVESVHQPVVSYASYTFDVIAGGGTLPRNEAQRLNEWLDSISLSYGDKIAIVTDTGYYSPSVRDDIADIVARRGLLVGEDSSSSAGTAPDGAVRLIVRRAVAQVPGCPNHTARFQNETEGTLSTTSNFGCGVNSNFAAMVANPEDLVRGQTTNTNLRTATSNRAISAYRDKKPTGSGGLQQIAAGGQ